jgi:transposase
MVLLVFLCSVLLAAATRIRPRRDFAGLEERRRKAARLFGKGKTQADVARELGVSRQSVSRWYADWRTGGSKALSSAGRAGRMPRLTDAQVEAVRAELSRGPLAHGYPTDLWTLARVAEVIERTTGVSYNHTHVWRVLRDRLGWTRQRPARRAIERNDEAIAHWVAEDWPRVKKTPGAGGPGSASRTSPASASTPR